MDYEPIGRLLGMTHRAHLIFVDEKLKEIDPDLHSGQFFLLHLLYKKEGICLHELSEYYRIDKAAVTRGIKKLEERGYVLKEKSSEDQRKTALRLTDKAKDLESSFTRMLEDIDARIKSYLEEDEIDTFMQLIDKIYHGISDEIERIPEKHPPDHPPSNHTPSGDKNKNKEEQENAHT